MAHAIIRTIVLLSFGAVISCNRAQEENQNTTLQFQLPKSGASTYSLSPSNLNLIILNISGPGINPPILWRWSRWETCNGGNCDSSTITPPSNISIPNLPKGSGRLIQALLIGKNSNVGTESYYYAEASKNFTNSSENVVLNPTLSGSSSTSGSASGQLLSAAGVGPTGRLIMMAQPTGASIPLVVDREEIFNGYFSIFLLDGVPLTYQLEGTTEKLFDGVTLSTTMFTSASAQVLRVEMPPHNQRRYQNMSATNEVRGAEIAHLGFWGLGGFSVSSKNSCYYNYNSYMIDQNRFATYSSGVWSNPLLWNYNTAGADKVTIAAGGFGTAVGSCSGNQYVDYFKFYPAELSSGDNEYAGFMGPYRQISDGESSGFLASTYNPASQTRSVKWNYLPGVTGGSGINGSTVFVKPGSGQSAETYQLMSGYNCQQLSSFGFQSYDLDAAAAINNKFVLSGSNYSEALVILCPYRIAGGMKDYFNSAAASKSYSKVYLAGSGQHSCTSYGGQGLKCWGNNNAYQLANGNSTATGSATNANMAISSNQKIVRIVATEQNTCTLFDDATIRCVGVNTNGELGNGTSTFFNSPQSVSIPSLSAGEIPVDIAGGYRHFCFLTNNKRVFCWGNNPGGEALGSSATSQVTVPTLVSSATDAVQISAGLDSTCAVMADTSLKCWGKNNYGQIGNGATSASPTLPTQIIASGVEKVRVGSSSACAILQTGEVKCWGENLYNTLGVGDTTQRNSPVTVLASSNEAADISMGVTVNSSEKHSCALLSGGSVRCWGTGIDGQLGNNTTNNITTASSPSALVVQAPFQQISAGQRFSCGAMFNGNIFCWGTNASGRVGDGTTTATNYNMPSVVVGQSN